MLMKEWINIKEFENYKVSNDGEVIGIYGRTLKGYICEKGYRYVILYKNKKPYCFKVSRIVAKAFPKICGEWFEGCVVDHLNGDRSDDRAVNLKVCTQKENMNNPITRSNQTKYHTEAEKRQMQRNSSSKWYHSHKEQAKSYNKKWLEKHPNYQHQWYLDNRKSKSTIVQTQ